MNNLPKCKGRQYNEDTENLSSGKFTNDIYTGVNCAYDVMGYVP